MTGQEQEPQDFRIVLANKVCHSYALVAACVGFFFKNISVLIGGCLQKFLYLSGSLSDKDKGNLQKEILDTVFAQGQYPLQLKCRLRSLC